MGAKEALERFPLAGWAGVWGAKGILAKVSWMGSDVSVYTFTFPVRNPVDPLTLHFPENTLEARRENSLRRNLLWKRWASPTEQAVKHL
ncbi:hypothetical protein YIM730264_20210 [Thermus hydrothermalis]